MKSKIKLFGVIFAIFIMLMATSVNIVNAESIQNERNKNIKEKTDEISNIFVKNDKEENDETSNIRPSCILLAGLWFIFAYIIFTIILFILA